MTDRAPKPWDPTPEEASVTRTLLEMLERMDESAAKIQSARSQLIEMLSSISLGQRERYERLAVGETRDGRLVVDPSDMPVRAMIAEVSAATRRSRRAVAAEFDEAWSLGHRFPAVKAAFGRGEIDEARASEIVGAGGRIADDELRGQYEKMVLPHAAEKTVRGTREAARRIAAMLEPEPFERRHAKARRERGVFVRDLDDGMAELRLVADAPVVVGAHDRLTQMARKITAARRGAADSGGAPSAEGMRCDGCTGAEHPCDDCVAAVAEIDALFAQAVRDGIIDGASASPGRPAVAGSGGPASAGSGGADDAGGTSIVDQRGFDEIRADLAVDLLLAGQPVAHHVFDPTGLNVLESVHARVQVTIPVETIAGLEDEPADLTGYGPAAAAFSRRVASDAANWVRVFHRPGTGALLTVDSYAPSAAQRRFLRTRDEVCCFAECERRALGADIDHTHDHALGGATDVTNLAHLCRHHHVLKHNSPWTPTLQPNGDMTWASPAGRIYLNRSRAAVKFVDAERARTIRRAHAAAAGESSARDAADDAPRGEDGTYLWVSEAMRVNRADIERSNREGRDDAVSMSGPIEISRASRHRPGTVAARRGTRAVGQRGTRTAGQRGTRAAGQCETRAVRQCETDTAAQRETRAAGRRGARTDAASRVAAATDRHGWTAAATAAAAGDAPF